ncbi:heterokaryon incompatibility protein-domain-containing protein [Cerioporus squamosus]|nr:heterokaryon incompatibility protein-domain-containing protein [Cerioporus squamosus]
MWLLSSDRAELHYYVAPEEVPDGYAILSHVWDMREHTFQDIQALRARCEGADTNPRDLLDPSDKIRRCCEVAQRHGYRWVWIDTCCIDKTSSAELSEAINSMFRWYALAKICYAYLKDVSSPPVANQTRRSGSMGASIWLKRGWTLQELLAPAFVVFVSADWGVLGTKADFAEPLEELTGIPFQVLTLQRPISDFSVAQRMSWAANRATTRVEDRAYCLMGIFGVTMPPLYGEGDMAFQRLQEEIMRNYDDSTLFAWSTKPFAIWPMQLRQIDEDALTEVGLRCRPQGHERSYSYLCAPNPSMEFYNITMSFTAYRATSELADTSLRPTFTLTPYAARAHIPVVEIDELHCSLILMPWVHQDTGWNVGLLFTPCATTSEAARPLQCICLDRMAYWAIEDGQLACLGRTRPASIRWTHVDLLHRLPIGARVDPRSSLHHPPLTLDTSLRAPFRFNALDKWRFVHYGWLYMSSPSTSALQRDSPAVPQWDGTPPALVAFSDGQGVQFTLRFGRCDYEPASEATDSSDGQTRGPASGQGALWADMQVAESEDEDELVARPHDCSRDHVDRWTLRTKMFSMGDDDGKVSWFMGYWKLRLAFTPCPLNRDTLVVHVVPRRHPEIPSSDTTSYRALYDELYLLQTLLFYWGSERTERTDEDLTRTIEELTHEVEVMKADLPHTMDDERRWLVEQSRMVMEKCRKIVEDIRQSSG